MFRNRVNCDTPSDGSAYYSDVRMEIQADWGRLDMEIVGHNLSAVLPEADRHLVNLRFQEAPEHGIRPQARGTKS